jgi:hypothetical protein
VEAGQRVGDVVHVLIVMCYLLSITASTLVSFSCVCYINKYIYVLRTKKKTRHAYYGFNWYIRLLS